MNPSGSYLNSKAVSEALGITDAAEAFGLLERTFKARKYPNVPIHALPIKRLTIKDANDLTGAIQKLIKYLGGCLARINTQGQYREDLGRWTKSGSTNGVSDLLGCFRGRCLAVEVKWGRDQMRADQKRFRSDIEAAGGVFIIARDLDGFLTDLKRAFDI